MVYSLYALGSTVGLVLVAIVTDSSQQAPAAYRPGFGDRVCWFSRRRALLVFFALPLMVIMTANVVLFVGSALIVRRAAQSAADATCRPSKVSPNAEWTETESVCQAYVKPIASIELR